MKKHLLIALTLVFALVLPLTGCSKSKEPSKAADDLKPIKLTLSSPLIVGNVFEKGVLEPIQKKLAERTNGKLTIEYFPNATLTSAAEALNATTKGISDISLIFPAYSAGELPITQIVEYPAKWNSARAAGYAIRDWLKEMSLEEYKKSNVTPLMAINIGESILYNNTREIKSMSDLSGLEIRGNAIVSKAINVWGGTGVAVPINDVYESVRTGIIDGGIQGSESVSSMKLTEITKYATRMPTVNSLFLIVINNNSLAKLPPEWQTILIDTFNEVFEATGADHQETPAAKTYDAYAQKGIKVYLMTDENNDKMADASKVLVEEYAKKLDSQGLEGSKALESFRKYADKYNKMYPNSTNPALKK